MEEISITQLREWIDWSPFFHAWDLKGKYPQILEDPKRGESAKKLLDDAGRLLDRIIQKKLLTPRGVYGFWLAAADGDDILVYTDQNRKGVRCHLHGLRQQWQRKGQKIHFSLADFIAPVTSGRPDFIGGFAVTAGIGCAELAAHFEAELDDYHAIMAKALADRLAEAFAEMLHARARADWGYGCHESLSPEEILDEAYRGIRPAPGYPSQPDHTEKRTLMHLLDGETATGIRLTEHDAMHPAASVCGLYFAHPEARYFALDRITREQSADYARRKGVTLGEVEKWLAPNLGYEPGRVEVEGSG